METTTKVIVIGLDGLEPKIVDALLARGELPHLERLRRRGGYARVSTTCPAQTPVAWSTFATGTNPGGHGIFDFLRRNPRTHLPDLALYHYEQTNRFAAPRAANSRRGTPLWSLLSEAGIHSTILRCPCTFPAENIRGRMLSGMGVPDLRGSLGTGTFYSSSAAGKARESELFVHVARGNGCITTHLLGPRNPRNGANAQLEIKLQPDPDNRSLVVQSTGQPEKIVVKQGEWSEWLRIKFKTGLFETVRGMVRFLLVRLEPELELYASPINFDPAAPRFPISFPQDYAAELDRELGTFHTTGMVEDHGGLNNERFDEDAYLRHCNQVMDERERMMLHELGRMKDGFFFCLFDTPDRIQHMFWRHGSGGPGQDGQDKHGLEHVIGEHYRRCDETVGKALEFADDDTLVIVLSDHGFSSFERGVHLNSWLCEKGLLSLKPGCHASDEGRFFQDVDWSRTRAYALGLAGIYVNLRGREEHGIVPAEEAARLKQEIARELPELHDAEHGGRAVRSVRSREQVYRGPHAAESPDLIVNFAEKYRVSWATALGGVPAAVFEDNRKKWSGDHIIDPDLVPGALFMNRPFHGDGASLVDLAPTILQALSVVKGEHMEGRSLLHEDSRHRP